MFSTHFNRICQKNSSCCLVKLNLNELEQHSREGNIIVNGMNIQSYTPPATRRLAKAPNQNSDGDDISESSMMRKNFVNFAEEKLNISVSEIEISVIHDLLKRKDGSMLVIVQFLSGDKKTRTHASKERRLKRKKDLQCMDDELQYLCEENRSCHRSDDKVQTGLDKLKI